MANTLGRPLLFTSVKELSEKIDKYFEEHDLDKNIPTITGLAVYLDVDRKTLYNYEQKDEFFPTIKRALNKCEEAIETRAMLGGINATMAIFSLKNNYNWVDKTETDVTSKGESVGTIDPVSAAAYAAFLKNNESA